MKTICVPKNKEGESALNFDEATPQQLIELNLPDTQFYSLWGQGFFDEINNLSGSAIDDFEDEKIYEKHKLERVFNSKIFDGKTPDKELNDIINKIKNLFYEAISRDTSIHFYF